MIFVKIYKMQFHRKFTLGSHQIFHSKNAFFPGSGVVTYYLRESGVIPYLEALGFNIVGYGCMTCIGNSGPLDEAVSEAVKKGEIVACGVLSGKNPRRNFLFKTVAVINYGTI